ncbi:hypothetical protein GCM10008957_41110 [Deinococcus ruber]|uniref:Uncharacterized protein n=1 Tax=Deinococcus ruber TaxID=1848197 RepID=A0A918CJW8_9DEIO|nr:hypothetical protein GCM10008957_41110 [Deinococcus ruber]
MNVHDVEACQRDALKQNQLQMLACQPGQAGEFIGAVAPVAAYPPTEDGVQRVAGIHRADDAHIAA